MDYPCLVISVSCRQTNRITHTDATKRFILATISVSKEKIVLNWLLTWLWPTALYASWVHLPTARVCRMLAAGSRAPAQVPRRRRVCDTVQSRSNHRCSVLRARTLDERTCVRPSACTDAAPVLNEQHIRNVSSQSNQSSAQSSPIEVNTISERKLQVLYTAPQHIPRYAYASRGKNT